MAKAVDHPAPAAAKARRRRKDDRPGEIVAAGLALFAERGFAATRLEDVAARAGASKGTLYLYFDTKEALFEAVVRDAFAPLLDRMMPAGEAPTMTAEAMLRLVVGTIYRELVATERREILRLLIAEANRFPRLVDFYHREVVGRGKALLRLIVARGVAAGEFRDGPAAARPELIIAPALFAAIWTLVFDRVEPMDLDQMLEAHLDLVLHGLRR